MNLKEIVSKNKNNYKTYMNIKSVPRIITNTGESIYSANFKTSKNILSGIPISPGVYEGNVRIIESIEGAKLNKGEILVTYSTNPGWTPLFINAGAPANGKWRTNIHGSIVVREYGIPAVVVENIVSKLKTVTKIRVNGT